MRASGRPGFSLLEVMVAIAILAGGLVVLLQIQARTIWMAQQAHNLTVASQLAQAKRLDCEEDIFKRGFSVGDYDESGKFDEEGYDQFFWECHAYQPELPVPDAADISGANLTGEGSPLSNMMGGPEGMPEGQNPMADMGMGMLAPVLSQISEAMKQSVRELVVIVRWETGDGWEEMRVATHLVDTAAINLIAAQLRQMTGQGGGGGAPSQGRPGQPMAPNNPTARPGGTPSDFPDPSIAPAPR